MPTCLPLDLYFLKNDLKPGKTSISDYKLTLQKPRHLYLSFLSDLLNKILKIWRIKGYFIWKKIHCEMTFAIYSSASTFQFLNAAKLEREVL